MTPTITTPLVSRLITAQFPEWAHLPLRPVGGGWDNRTFRLGEDLCVRLPSAERYVPQVDKEHRWLPVLAPHLPLPIPVPVAKGVPGDGYPWPWSVFRWLDGEDASRARIDDETDFALTLGGFLAALHRVDASGGPPAGPHNFHRGGALAEYDSETRDAIEALKDDIDAPAACALWNEAIQSTWPGAPGWVHGDVSAANLLVRDGRLRAVIDFGTLGVGDPACDVTMAWTFFSGASREAFRAALSLDEATWTRGRGWALWKALVSLRDHREHDARKADAARRVLRSVLLDGSG